MSKANLEDENYKKLSAIRDAVRAAFDEIAVELDPTASKLMKEVLDFRESITHETDRGAVLMSAAFLDDKIRDLIQARLVQDKKVIVRSFGPNGALGSFSSRIDFAYLIGVISKNARRDLHTIRGIRNQFAHYAAPLSYEDEIIAPLCQKLVLHGEKGSVDPGTKYRRTVMHLLSLITVSTLKVEGIPVAPDSKLPDNTPAKQMVEELLSQFNEGQ